MKSHVAACTVLTLVCILLLYLPVHAQDFSTTELFPNYEVETLHKTDESKDMVFPFIHKGSLYAFSLAYRIPIWKIFIGGDLLSPYTVGAVSKMKSRGGSSYTADSLLLRRLTGPYIFWTGRTGRFCLPTKEKGRSMRASIYTKISLSFPTGMEI